MRCVFPLALVAVASVAHTAPTPRTRQAVVFVIDRAPAQLAATKQLVVDNLRLLRADDPVAIITTSGQGVAALREAFAILDGAKPRWKHVVFISDRLEPAYDVYHLADGFDAAHITVDAISLDDAARDMLSVLSRKGMSRMWNAKRDVDISMVVRTALTQQDL